MKSKPESAILLQATESNNSKQEINLTAPDERRQGCTNILQNYEHGSSQWKMRQEETGVWQRKRKFVPAASTSAVSLLRRAPVLQLTVAAVPERQKQPRRGISKNPSRLHMGRFTYLAISWYTNAKVWSNHPFEMSSLRIVSTGTGEWRSRREPGHRRRGQCSPAAEWHLEWAEGGG